MLEIKASVAVSNRHVHLTKEVYEMLFDETIMVKKQLNQVGEYAAEQTLTIKSNKGIIENVRVMGPFRKYNQVEISKNDARKLGINPPVRESGDLMNSETITLVTKKNEVTLNNACIIAQRHIHMNNEKAKELGLSNQEKVNIVIDNAKGGIMEAFVKVTEKGFYEIHIDVDDANAFLLNTNDEVIIKKI